MMAVFKTVRWAYFDSNGRELPQTACEGYAKLVLGGIRGRVARISTEQVLLSTGFPAVFLGAEFEDDYEVEVPPSPSFGRIGGVFRGFTDDPDVVALTQDFRAAVDSGRFYPQIILSE